jgi:hypothetical protein
MTRSLIYFGKRLLVKPTEAAVVRLGETNCLSVVAVGSHLMFYINDQLVAEVDDKALRRGFVGVVIDLQGGGALAEVEFDNFELRESTVSLTLTPKPTRATITAASLTPAPTATSAAKLPFEGSGKLEEGRLHRYAADEHRRALALHARPRQSIVPRSLSSARGG